MTPRKESEAVPEEFARVEADSNERSVFIGDKRVVVFTNPHEVENSDAANYAAYTINLAHRRAVKDAVVKALEMAAKSSCVWCAASEPYRDTYGGYQHQNGPDKSVMCEASIIRALADRVRKDGI